MIFAIFLRHYVVAEAIAIRDVFTFHHVQCCIGSVAIHQILASFHLLGTGLREQGPLHSVDVARDGDTRERSSTQTHTARDAHAHHARPRGGRARARSAAVLDRRFNKIGEYVLGVSVR